MKYRLLKKSNRWKKIWRKSWRNYKMKSKREISWALLQRQRHSGEPLVISSVFLNLCGEKIVILSVCHLSVFVFFHSTSVYAQDQIAKFEWKWLKITVVFYWFWLVFCNRRYKKRWQFRLPCWRCHGINWSKLTIHSYYQRSEDYK